MKNDVSDDKLFHLGATDAYAELHANAFPSIDSDVPDNDWTHLVSVESLSDDGYNIFLIESGDGAKLLCGRGNDLLSVREITLKRGEFQAIANEAIRTWEIP
jgi:hypothetical protein